MSAISGRALHYVFRIGNRQASYDFYVKKLGMKILRHEEFKEGCKASCNGPYYGAWSKTMVGYGNEDQHFVLELTYNYGISNYKLGNDFHGIFVESSAVLLAINGDAPAVSDGSRKYRRLADPDGHAFYVSEGNAQRPVTKVAINVHNLDKSKAFWHSVLTMKVESVSDSNAVLSFGEDQCRLELRALPAGQQLDRGTAFGRIAFSCPADQLKPLEAKVKADGAGRIHTGHIVLDTPGKATVEVVILQDPNDHEICFVGEEAYLKLSKPDPKADELLRKAIDDEAKWNDGQK